jgi:drug/metabolite transporter (DMT)-like permease
MGYVLGIGSAGMYSLASILSRIGQRSRPTDDGLLITNFMNAVVLGLFAIMITWPTWHLTGFIALVAGGIFGTVLGRFMWFRGIRLVGPSRANTFSVAVPVPTAIAAWIFLGEGLSVWEMLGGAITIFGLYQIVRSRTVEEATKDIPLRSYLIAASAPLFFGLAIFFRKWGLERFPGAISGAFVGSAVGLIFLTFLEASRGTLVALPKKLMADPPWEYLAAGFILAFALLAQFRAFPLLDAWVVGITGGTVAIWTPFLSRAILKQEEAITMRLIANIGVVFAGIVVIAVV